MNDFKDALSSSAGVDRGITNSIWQTSNANKIIVPPNQIWFFRKSCNVQSNASKDLLCGIVHLSQTINLLCCNTLVITEFLERLQVGVSFICMFNDNLRVEWAILLPSNNVAAKPD